MKKQVFLILTCSLLLWPFQAAAATIGDESQQEAVWVQERDRWWYRYEDGTYPRSQWSELGGRWYHFDAEGYMQTGLIQVDGVYYYLSDGDGSMIVTDSRVVNGQTYYFDDTGAGTLVSSAIVESRRSSWVNEMSGPGVSRWIQDGDRWLYRYEDGTYPQSQWAEFRGKWYHFDAEGYMQTGPILLDGVYYYLNEEDGSMITGESRSIDGRAYHFNDTGAGTLEWAYKPPLAVPPESEKSEFHKNVDAMADAVLARITNSGMSQREKATAIYWWVKRNMTYSGSSPVGDWVGGAYDGLRKHRGDCYTYYALSAELLTRAELQTIEVVRSSDNNHYWNLVNVDGAWYHFDPCPRRLGGDWCLVTDRYIAGSSAHVFDHSLYPPTP